MPNTDEQRKDILENCEILLEKLYPFQEADNTAEGRMISQLKWLRERAGNYDLNLPVDKDMLSTLRRVHLDGELWHLASSRERIVEEIEVPMTRLITLTKVGQLLLKSDYYPYAIRCINALIITLQNPSRPLSAEERGLIAELISLKKDLSSQRIEPPLVNYLPNYPNFHKVYWIHESSIDDMPGGKWLIETVANFIFEGIRPDNWLTPEDANKATALWSALIID